MYMTWSQGSPCLKIDSPRRYRAIVFATPAESRKPCALKPVALAMRFVTNAMPSLRVRSFLWTSPPKHGTARGRRSLFVLSHQVVNQPADAAGRCPDARALFAARQRADRGACSRTATHNQQLLLPGPLIRVRGLLSSLDDAWGTDQLVAGHPVAELHRMQSLRVANVDRVRAVGVLLRNEEVPLLAVGQRDRHQRALEH